MTEPQTEFVTGILTNSTGENFAVRLRLTTVPKAFETNGREGRDVIECALASGNFPDGDYAIEYPYGTLIRKHVRVSYGVFCFS